MIENHSEKHRAAQTLDGELVKTFRDLASQHDISVLVDSIYEKTPDEDKRLCNTSILSDRQGELNGVFRKIHMCDAPRLGYNESVGIKPGNIPVVVDHEMVN
jgi:predicted amidohydrolase